MHVNRPASHVLRPLLALSIVVVACRGLRSRAPSSGRANVTATATPGAAGAAVPARPGLVRFAHDDLLCECSPGGRVHCTLDQAGTTTERDISHTQCVGVTVNGSVVCVLREGGEVACQREEGAPVVAVWRAGVMAGHRTELRGAGTLLCVADLDEGWFECARGPGDAPDAGAPPAGSSPPSRVTTQGRVHSFAVGPSHLCASTTEGELRCWEDQNARELETPVVLRPMRLPATPRAPGVLACGLDSLVVGLPGGGALAMGRIGGTVRYVGGVRPLVWSDSIDRLPTGAEPVTDVAVSGEHVYVLTSRKLRWWGSGGAGVARSPEQSGECPIDGDGVRFVPGSPYASPCVLLREGTAVCGGDGASLCRQIGAS